MWTRATNAVERPEQYRDPRKAEPVAEPVDVGCDQAEVLRDHRQRPELLLGRPEDGGAGTATPRPVRRLLSGRDRPEPGEAAEVIDPEDVDEVEHAAHPLRPPVVAARSERLPVVERVAPVLPAAIELVGGRAGDEFVDGQEQIRVTQVVATALGDVDRHVADDPDPALARVGAQLLPLALEAHLVLELAVVGLPVAGPIGLTLAEGDKFSGGNPRARFREEAVPASERRRRRIRRAELVGRPERQYLPPARAGGREPIHEREGLPSEAPARKRRRMEDDPERADGEHGGCLPFRAHGSGPNLDRRRQPSGRLWALAGQSVRGRHGPGRGDDRPRRA